MTDCLCPDIKLQDVNDSAEIEFDEQVLSVGVELGHITTSIEIELDKSGGWKNRNKYNLNDRDWLGEPNADGTLVASTSEINPVFNGVMILDSQILREKFSGDAFAVWSSGTYSTSASRQAWRAVDGNTSSSYYWYSKNEANPIYEFYNPYPIKLASLKFYWTSASYCAKSFVLNVSNDGSTWTSLGTFNLTVAATATANINSANAYKYYRMTFTKQSTYLRLKELEMSATKYE